MKKRLQGKACFTFTAVDAGTLKQLAALTKKGIDSFKTLQLPWDEPKKRAGHRSSPP